jgi:hypothetical protein
MTIIHHETTSTRPEVCSMTIFHSETTATSPEVGTRPASTLIPFSSCTRDGPLEFFSQG